MATAAEVPKIVELILSGAVTIAASFIGAYLAFLFNKNQRKDELTRSQIDACNGAIISITRQYTVIRNYYDQQLIEFEDRPGRHLQMDALMPIKPAFASVDLPSLNFLLSTDARDIVSEISILETKFAGCIDLINRRSEIHQLEFQPAAARVFSERGASRVEGEEMAKAIGDKLNITMTRVTDQIFREVGELLPRLEKVGKEFAPALKKIFPGERFFTFVPFKSDKRERAKTTRAVRADYVPHPGYILNSLKITSHATWLKK